MHAILTGVLVRVPDIPAAPFPPEVLVRAPDIPTAPLPVNAALVRAPEIPAAPFALLLEILVRLPDVPTAPFSLLILGDSCVYRMFRPHPPLC